MLASKLNRNESIIEKIKGLLAIANDHKNDEESQTAFIMAQKLMIKYDISSTEVESGSKDERGNIDGHNVTVYKTLYWWERELASIISKNFKVKYFLNSKILKGDSKKKRRIMFFGYDSDVELAKEMYILAYDVLTFYTNEFVESHYVNTTEKRSRRKTFDLKNSYIRGFLSGIEAKFEDQLNQLKEEYGLTILTPVPIEVAKAFEEMSKEWGASLKYSLPTIEEIEAYHKGFQDGNTVDYTKSTIEDEM